MKKTGKALSLVLSLALVVSSIPATFASAAGRSAKTASSVSIASTSITLCNGGASDAQLTSPELLNNFTVTSAELSDHSPVTNLTLKDVVMASNSVATLVATKNGGDYDSIKLKLKNKDVAGTVTLYARYEGSANIGTDEDATKVYGTKTFTATVVANKTTYIAAAATDAGKAPTALASSMAKNAGKDIDGVVETVAPGTDAKATYTAQKVSVSKEAGSYYLESSNTAVAAVTTNGATAFKLTNVANTQSNTAYAKIGAFNVVAQLYKTSNGNAVADTAKGNRVAAKSAVANKVNARPADTIISKYGSKTYLGKVAADKDNTKTTTTATPPVNKDDPNALLDVTGCDVDLTACTNAVTMQDGKLGAVTVGNALIVEGGQTGDVTVAADKTLTINNGTVGNIADAGAVSVKGGKTGNVSGAGTLTVEVADAKAPVTVGDVDVATFTATAEKANAKFGTVKTSADSRTVTLAGTKITVAKIDSDYRMSTISLQNFTGSIPAPTNSYTEGIDSTPKYVTLQTEEGTGLANTDSITTDATVTGKAYLNAVDIESGKLTIADSATIGTMGVTGSGTLQFAPGALYTKGDISGVNVRLTKDFNVGDKIFTADTDVVSEDDFTGVGFTAEKKAANTTTDLFTVKDMSFAGISIEGSDKIAEGATETYTVKAYPTGKDLPAGYTIQWAFSGYDNYLSVGKVAADDTTKITVTAGKADTVFDSLNEGTLTATVLDENGLEDPSYAVATKKVSIGSTKKFTSDTSNKDMKVGETYQFKITSADGSQPDFVVASQGATVVANGKSGNDYFYKVTAAKVGTFGIYCGDKVAIIKVTSGISIDTKTVTKKAGEPYQFKVTVSNGKAPEFKIATVGAVKASSSKGNDFFFQYTVKSSDAKGTHGVYVNGERLASFIFA